MAVWIADASSVEFGKYVPTKIAELGGYKKEKGTYYITFAVAEKASVKKTIKASISDDTPKAPVTNVTNRTTNNTPAPNVTVNPPAASPVTVNPPAVETPEPVVVTVAGVTEPAPTVAEAIIDDGKVPEAAPKYWHLLDLLFAIASLILGFYLMIVAMRRKEEEEDDPQKVNQGKQIRMWGVLGVTLGIASIVTLLLTQQFDGVMKLADAWTLLFAAIFGAELLASFGVNSKQQDEWSQERSL
jgi:hypothetical protein